MKQTKRSQSLTADLCVNAILIALVLVATLFINIRLPISINGGLIHLGNVPLVMAAIVFGKKKGAVAGACGMGLFDVLGGWMLWAPFTFVIRGVMGFVIGWIAEKKQGKSVWLNLLAILAGGVCMMVGYYFTEVILYQNWVAPFTSVPGNAIQTASALVLGLPLATLIKKQNILPYMQS